MGRILACADIHGCYDLWIQIKKELKEDDFLYFLGDAADRGQDGLKIMQELLDMKAANKCEYIQGNHEDMFIICMTDYLQGNDLNFNWWIANGGYATYSDATKLSDEEIKHLINKLCALKQRIDITNKNGDLIHLTHAGFSPGYSFDELRMKGRKIDYIWDRDHFHDDWKGLDNEYVIHGHTPVSYMEHRDTPRVIKYNNKHKINLDMGAFFHNRTVLFNLDTLEVEKYFDAKGEF